MEEIPPTHPETLSSPEPLPKALKNDQSPPKKKLNFRKVNRQLTTIISISLKLTGIVAALLLFLAVVRQLSYSGYQLQEVHVPRAFEDAGITGNALAAQITANIQQIKHNVESNKV